MCLIRQHLTTVAALVLLSGLLGISSVASAREDCTFTLGFEALRDKIPGVVGDCLEKNRFNSVNGNFEQRTTGGLLVWRKADNWIAFTNGTTTWIDGPDGVVSRPDDGPLFPWEVSGAPTAGAAGSAAPAVGAAVTADTLVGRSGFRNFTCPTGRGEGALVGEGYILKVTGKCLEDDPDALVVLSFPYLLFVDGEVRVDVKVVSGHDRANFIVIARDQEPPGRFSFRGYQAQIQPGYGPAQLIAGETTLRYRWNLTGQPLLEDWNTVALRLRGPDLWLLVNDQVVARASDARYERGQVHLALERRGLVSDTAETAAVFRNFRISRLREGNPTREPSVVRET